jgi:type IV secretory pathway VirB10-like protein
MNTGRRSGATGIHPSHSPAKISVLCMTGSDQPDWSEIRRLFAAGAPTLARIAERYGVSVQRITRRARKDGWPARSVRPSGATKRPPGKPARDTSSVPVSLKARRTLVRRLYKAIDTKLKQMERRMAHDMATDDGTSDTTAADHERDTRAIGALIANLSRVTEIEADLERLPGSAKPADQQADRQLADEAERFRREVAERLARLVRPAGG